MRYSSRPREVEAVNIDSSVLVDVKGLRTRLKMYVSMTVRSPRLRLLSPLPDLALGLCLLDAVSERIMQFVQCSADVGELERVRQCRDQRASLRAEGLRLTRALVAAAASPPAKVMIGRSSLFGSRFSTVLGL